MTNESANHINRKPEWSQNYSATTRPPIARWTCSIPLGEILPPPPTSRGPRPGCRTPSAAPSIRLPGSPILGGADISWCRGCGCCRLVLEIDESEPRRSAPATASPSDELMSAFNVGCEGRLGRVGEGSRSA